MLKYRNKKNIYKGIKFDSIKERNRYIELLHQQKNKFITGLELQPVFELIKNKIGSVKYIADFKYKNNKGEIIIEDVKGYKKGAGWQVFRIKQKLLFEKLGLEIKIV